MTTEDYKKNDRKSHKTEWTLEIGLIPLIVIVVLIVFALKQLGCNVDAR